MDCGVSDSFGRVFPNKVYATLEIRACRVTVVQPLLGVIYSNSRVHGNRTLGVVSVSATTTTNYMDTIRTVLRFPVLLSRRVVEKGSRDLMLLFYISIYIYIYIIIITTL